MSTLPPELWLLILRWATLSLHPLPVVPDMMLWQSDDSRSREYLATLPTKIAVVLVCKAWNELATKFLYEYIEISHIVKLGQVAYALESSTRKNGWWMKRLDIGFIDINWDGNESEGSIVHLTKIIQQCPNLLIYNDRGSAEASDTPPAIIGALAQTCGPSIQRLYWDFTRGPVIEQLASLLRSSPYLRTLGLWFIDRQDPYLPSPLLRGIQLEYLIVIEIHLQLIWQIPAICTWDLPALTHVVFLDTTGMTDFTAMYTFLHVYGPKLLSLGYSCAQGLLPAEMDGNLMLDLCPELQQLQIPIVVGLKPVTTSHRNLRDIGINVHWHLCEVGVIEQHRGDSSEIIPQCIELFDGHIQAFSNPRSFPSLKRVRMLALNVTDFELMCPTKGNLRYWITVIETWKKRSVRFEGGKGELMEDILEQIMSSHVRKRWKKRLGVWKGVSSPDTEKYW